MELRDDRVVRCFRRPSIDPPVAAAAAAAAAALPRVVRRNRRRPPVDLSSLRPAPPLDDPTVSMASKENFNIRFKSGNATRYQLVRELSERSFAGGTYHSGG